VFGERGGEGVQVGRKSVLPVCRRASANLRAGYRRVFRSLTRYAKRRLLLMGSALR
jgi:hypothetical protein